MTIRWFTLIITAKVKYILRKQGKVMYSPLFFAVLSFVG